ncbi:hypothetical protein GOV09_00645 [Candidatus Woesearchaeota archaeon]|nr:hypothetical protein [Candidatus Woesearchaeota archaeon]
MKENKKCWKMRYYHQSGPVGEAFGGASFANHAGTDTDMPIQLITGWKYEQKIIYKGDAVLVCERVLNINGVPQPNILIPGRILSREGNVSEIEPIKDDTEKKKLTDLIRSKNMKGPVNFW